MPFLLKDKLKYKFLTKDELIINLDRLSRFKLPEESFNRVFISILINCLISPKYSKKELENLSADIISDYVKTIWNSSVKNLFPNFDNNNYTNNALKMTVQIPFKITDERTKTFINTKLILSPILNSLDINSVPLNLKFLIMADKIDEKLSNICIDNLRSKYSLKFPIKKLIIVEGITEENLLPVFAKKLGYDFDKLGIYILGAGGKSKSPSLYIKLRDKLNIPVILLFDNDAVSVCNTLKKQLKRNDKIIVINNGEFEDILSLNLIKRTLNKEFTLSEPIIMEDLHKYNKMCDNLEYFFRTRNIGEFKKSKFSQLIAQNIKYDTDITEDVKKIINDIV